MFMKKTATALALVLASSFAASAETTLVFNRYLPDQNEIMRTGVLPWAKAVEEASNGSVTIDFTASSLAPPPAQLDMIRSGIADAAINLSSFTAKQWLPLPDRRTAAAIRPCHIGRIFCRAVADL